MKGFFERAGHEAGVIQNPFSGCDTKVKKTIHRQPFTQEELTNILEHCDAISRPITLIAMCTAMRRGDCCRLKWESVDMDSGFIMVKTSKTGETAEHHLLRRPAGSACWANRVARWETLSVVRGNPRHRLRLHIGTRGHYKSDEIRPSGGFLVP